MYFINNTEEQIKVRFCVKGEYRWRSVYPGETINCEFHQGIALGLDLVDDTSIVSEQELKPEQEDELAELRKEAEILWGPIDKQLTKIGFKRLISKGKKLKEVAESASKAELDVDGNGEYDEADFQALSKKKFKELKKKA